MFLHEVRVSNQAYIAGVCGIIGIILGFVGVHQHGIDVPSTHKVSVLSLLICTH